MEPRTRAVPTILDALASAAIRIFRPLVRILLRHNVSYKTCADWLRWCYADVAAREFTVPGRKQSNSRVAVLTGLTRVDVGYLLKMPPPDQVHQEEQYHRAGLVLSGWVNDPAYRDGDGNLLELPFENADGPSFSDLVNRFSGGTPPRAVLDELELSGAVEVRTDRTIRVLRPRYIPRANDREINYAQVFGLACGELINTIHHNWCAAKAEKRLQLVAYNDRIDPRLIPEAKQRVEDAARELTEQVDAILYEYEQRSRAARTRETSDNPDAPVPRIGLGLYFFRQEPDEPQTDDSNTES